jgi:hypothetical protein
MFSVGIVEWGKLPMANQWVISSGRKNVPAQLWALLFVPLASNIAIKAVIATCDH